MTRVVVIGAGMAGLACARTLADHGVAVRVVDKGRGVGGRMATRKVESVGTFDHGAQYFTTRTASFTRLVASWSEEGVVAPFALDAPGRPTVDTRWVGQPGMSAVCRRLARGIDVTSGVRAARIARREGMLELRDEEGARIAEADAVVVAIPAPQARELLSPLHEELAGALAAVEMDPCWALMLGLEATTRAPALAARDPSSAIGWIAREDAKRGERAGTIERWIVHASHDWSRAHLERTPEEVRDLLLGEARAWMGSVTPVHAAAHRWRWARTTRPLGMPYLGDVHAGLFVAGDYCLGDRVEHAFTSGVAAAERLLAG